MSNDSMGNLEKLGILVIVILVVVVGVVAITPSDTLFERRELADLDDENTNNFEPVPVPAPRPIDPAPEPDPWPIPMPDDRTVDRPDDSRQTVNGNLRPNTPVPQPPAPQPPQIKPAPAPPASAPSFREITVQKNDSLWNIAERELGKGSLWGVIARANPSVNVDRLQPGQKLRIPLETGTAPAERRERLVRAAAVKTYTIKPGDTPMGVSSLHYGTVRHYGFLLEHNGLDEDGFQADLTIEIPPLPEKASNLTPASGSSSSRAAPASNGERFYEVKKGDFPGTIAREQLGDERRWREILRLNGIADASELIAGSRIRLPRR